MSGREDVLAGGSTDQMIAEIRRLRERIEDLESARDFLARDQLPLERRMRRAEAKASAAEDVAARAFEALRLPLHSKGVHKPGAWEHDLAAIALGCWGDLPEVGDAE